MTDRVIEKQTYNRRTQLMGNAPGGSLTRAVQPAPPPVDDDTTEIRAAYLAAARYEDERRLTTEDE